tara:strand:- start:1460 stop:2512 length:1053 start_codon:yes stop_codon:yes gene_type:complete
MQWRRYDRAQVFVFDKGRSARAAILAMNGTHVELGGTAQPILQPLRHVDRASDARFAVDWLAGLLDAEGLALTPERKARLWEAISSLASAPQAERTLTGLALLLQGETIRAALHPFTLEGPHGSLLDGDRDALTLSSLACFEMEELMASPQAAPPVLSYLFHRIEEELTGAPTLIILDEAWLFLDHPLFAKRLREWLKTLRKKNVAVIFATQSLADIEQSDIAPALIESCPTRIFLPNERAREPLQKQIYERFGLNRRQIDIIAEATPKRDYYFQSPEGARVFDLGLGPIGLAFCASAAPEAQTLIDTLLGQTSLHDFPHAFLDARGLDWAAALLTRWPSSGSHLPIAAE